MLKGKQKKLDKNRDGKITGADFALMRKSGYKMGGEFKMNDSDRMTNKDIKTADKSARVLEDAQKILGSDRMTKKDVEKASSAVGKRKGGMLKARSGASADRMTKRDVEYGTRKTIGLDPMDVGITAATGITGAAGLGAAGMILNEARKKYKKQKEYKKSKGSMTQGSFRVGGLSRQRLDSISNYRNKQAQMKKEKQKEENKIGRAHV